VSSCCGFKDVPAEFRHESESCRSLVGLGLSSLQKVKECVSYLSAHHSEISSSLHANNLSPRQEDTD
jgi:hypothetical protein